MNELLKPCPMCGALPNEVRDGNDILTIVCPTLDCRLKVGGWVYDDKVRDAWNRRKDLVPFGDAEIKLKKLEDIIWSERDLLEQPIPRTKFQTIQRLNECLEILIIKEQSEYLQTERKKLDAK